MMKRLEDEYLREMREEGLLQPTLVKPAESRVEQNAPALVNASDDPDDLPF
ncbi:MAG: hypothetical protein ACREEM_32805 [Blastocatellia bacterium]